MHGNNIEEGPKHRYNTLIDHIVARLIKINADQSEDLQLNLIRLYLAISSNVHCELKKQALINVVNALYLIHICIIIISI